ncbi:MAG: hypothetical protein J2P54_11170 [Bradyrhizobiaceae bacterium]|nr:hypothetical protein [Bradyrhizobiaceae bacterium]
MTAQVIRPAAFEPPNVTLEISELPPAQKHAGKDKWAVTLRIATDGISRGFAFLSMSRRRSLVPMCDHACCGHRSSYHYRRTALPTFADYAVGNAQKILMAVSIYG